MLKGFENVALNFQLVCLQNIVLENFTFDYLSSFNKKVTYFAEFVQGGCYQEDPWGKGVGVLDPPKGSGIPKKKDLDMKNNGPAACGAFCKGYKYFHLSARNRCFCGNNINGPLKKVPETDCSSDCPGDKTKKCGANYRLNLYKVEGIERVILNIIIKWVFGNSTPALSDGFIYDGNFGVSN